MLPLIRRPLLLLLTLAVAGLVGCDHEVKEAVRPAPRPAPCAPLSQHA